MIGSISTEFWLSLKISAMPQLEDFSIFDSVKCRKYFCSITIIHNPDPTEPIRYNQRGSALPEQEGNDTIFALYTEANAVYYVPFGFTII